MNTRPARTLFQGRLRLRALGMLLARASVAAGQQPTGQDMYEIPLGGHTMKQNYLRISLVFLSLSLCLFAPAFSAPQDALPNLAARPAAALPSPPVVLNTFMVPPCNGLYPWGVAFDSINRTMWVAFTTTPTGGAGYVCEFALTFPYPFITRVAVTDPYALTFDAATRDLWVTDPSANTVTVVNTIFPGAIVAPSPLATGGATPAGDCFYAGDIWAMNLSSNSFTGFLQFFPFPPTPPFPAVGGGASPFFCVAAGADLWLTLIGTNNVERVAPPAPGAAFPVGMQPWGITYDGTSVWVANFGSNTLEALNPATGVPRFLPAFNVAPGIGPTGLVFGTVAGVNYVWAVDEVSGTLTQIQVLPGLPWFIPLGTSAVFGSGPQFGAFDPINDHIWVTSTKTGTITVLH